MYRRDAAVIVRAMDRSCRSFDIDGRLHVSVTNISKATVNPYAGREIPGYGSMGLDPDNIYMMFRHPDELVKAASTFNNLPVLNCHVEVSAASHKPENVVGSTGTDATFAEPYLQNSAVVWARDSIDLIESDQQREWSCGYRYEPDMTPGIWKGLHYDGIMRNIVGNHVALVREGRAGPDVVVGDSKMRNAFLLHGAVAAIVGPKLATDSAVNFAELLSAVAPATLSDKLAADIVALTEGKLATDATLTVADVKVAIDAAFAADDAMCDDADPDDEEEDDSDGDGGAGAGASDKKKKKGKAMDAEKPATAMTRKEPPASKKSGAPAMDAAAVRSEMSAIRTAEREAHPYIGDIETVPETGAAGVYKLALDAKGVSTAGVHPSAFRAMVGMLGRDETPRVTADSAIRGTSIAEFNEFIFGKAK